MPRPCKLTFDLFTLKVVPESRVMWATSVPIVVFLGLSDDVRDRQTDVRRASSLNAPYPRGGGHNTKSVAADRATATFAARPVPYHVIQRSLQPCVQ